MALEIGAAGFTAGEADQVRRAMAAWKRKGDKFLRFEGKFIDGMLSRGGQRDFAQVPPLFPALTLLVSILALVRAWRTRARAHV